MSNEKMISNHFTSACIICIQLLNLWIRAVPMIDLSNDCVAKSMAYKKLMEEKGD